jgi:hypothetical protein
MSLATIAIVNGILAIGIVSAFANVCRLPFCLDRVDAPAQTPIAVEPTAAEELAA